MTHPNPLKCAYSALAPSSYSNNTTGSHISDFPQGSSILTAHQPVNCKSLETHVMELPEGEQQAFNQNERPPLFLSVMCISDQLSLWHTDQQKYPQEQSATC